MAPTTIPATVPVDKGSSLLAASVFFGFSTASPALPPVAEADVVGGAVVEESVGSAPFAEVDVFDVSKVDVIESVGFSFSAEVDGFEASEVFEVFEGFEDFEAEEMDVVVDPSVTLRATLTLK